MKKSKFKWCKWAEAVATEKGNGDCGSSNAKRDALDETVSRSTNDSKRWKLAHSFTCSTCGGVYKQKKKFDEHQNCCTEQVGLGYTLQRALKMAHSIVYLDNDL